MVSCDLLALLTTPIRSGIEDSYGSCGQSDQLHFVREQKKQKILFQLLAKEMIAQHVGLLLYTKVCWLSRGRCLHWLYELRNKVEVFLQVHENVQFRNKEFIMYDARIPGKCIWPLQRNELVVART